MTFYALIHHGDKPTFRGVFETIHSANVAIANRYIEYANDGNIDSDFKYKEALFYAYEDEDKDLIDILETRYHDFIYNGLEMGTYSTDYEIIPISLNEFLIDE